MSKERRQATGADKTKAPAPTTKRAAATRSAADKQRALQLLAKAKTRDLTADELKVLSVVQLSEYATIRHTIIAKGTDRLVMKETVQ
jgi:hypothetical protein